MNEKMPTPERQMTKEEYVRLAQELSERREGFPFGGLEDASYETLKKTDEEYPGFTTPITKLVPRFAAEGIKVMLGDDPKSGNVFILPMGSNNVERDSVLPRHLKVTDDMDPKLKALVLYSKTVVAAR